MLTPRLRFLIFNFLGLQITWAACAYGAINSMGYLGVVVGGLYIFLHFIYTTTRFEDFWTLILVTAIGVIIDSLNAHYGVIEFNSTSVPFLIPYWLIMLWAVFSLMIPHSLYWLSNNYFIAAIAGGIGGAFSYWLGHELGAIILSESLLTSTLIYFLEWSILFPIALLITSNLFRIGKKAQIN